jgi:hypothetical protein
MPEDPPFNVYREQLSSLSYGLALWNPNPPTIRHSVHLDPQVIYRKVSIADVGYLHEGSFVRMFNVMLPRYHPRNATLCYPGFNQPLDFDLLANTKKSYFDRVEHYSRGVSVETTAGIVPDKTLDE